MARNPVARSLRSGHLQARVYPNKRPSLRERLGDEDIHWGGVDWPEDPLGDWHGRNE